MICSYEPTPPPRCVGKDPGLARRQQTSYESKPVLSNREVAPGVRYLEIEFPVDFTPGQCVSLEIQGVKRHYSIATSSGADELGILYDVFDRGELTPLLSELTSGEAIDVSKPFGEFSCDPNHPAAWIATGTGVAPFLSMVRSGMRSGFMLIHGARRRERFYFSTELSEVLGNRYIRCLSPEQLFPQVGSS